MKYEIVSIEEQHINGFWSAVDSVAREHKYLAFLEAPPIETTRKFVLDHILNDWPQFVAVREGKVIGWCDISSSDRPVFAHVGSLGIGVIEGYREMGVGRALMKVALQKAQQKRLTRIELTVRENNRRAINLYEDLGFVIEGIHRNGVCVDGKYENHTFMALLWC